MGDTELPPDPYLALGVSKDADAATIKTAYRKLVLKCHPDKVPDPDAKQAAADRFHVIQTSYERLIDDKARARYDAEVKLAELRKERAAYRSSNDPAPRSTNRPSQEPSRPSYDTRSSAKAAAPTYEERRPAYADYFDAPPRPARKEPEYERSSRRPAVEVKEKSRASVKEVKETERRDKARRQKKDEQRDRDQKHREAFRYSDSDELEDSYRQEPRRARKDSRDGRRRDDERREERRPRDVYPEPASRRQEAADEIISERSRKLDEQHESARSYIVNASRSRQAADARPAPVRKGSSRDSYDYGSKGEARPTYVYRQPSSRHRASSREPEMLPRPSHRDAPRERERYSSSEEVPRSRMDEVSRSRMDEVPRSRMDEAPRSRPPTFNTSKSSPDDLRNLNKPRAQSVQHEGAIFEAPPSIKRAGTMPVNGSRGRTEKSYSPTEFNEGLATPGATPEFRGMSPPKYRSSAYADDREYPTPDGYRTADPYYTEIREPASARDGRDRRSNSSRYPERPHGPPLNVRTTSYVYDQRSGGVENIASRPRPSASREPSAREPVRLFGEVPSASPRTAHVSPSDERYPRTFRPPEEFRVQSGYATKPSSSDRPNVMRNGSAIHAR